MKNKELIAALQTLDLEAEVTINIKQHNKAYGKQLPIISTFEHRGYEDWVTGGYSGCTITVHLPAPAIIIKFPE